MFLVASSPKLATLFWFRRHLLAATGNCLSSWRLCRPVSMSTPALNCCLLFHSLSLSLCLLSLILCLCLRLRDAHEWDALELLYQTLEFHVKVVVAVVCLPKIMTCLEVQIAHFLSGSSVSLLPLHLSLSLCLNVSVATGVLAWHGMLWLPLLSLSRPDDGSW